MLRMDGSASLGSWLSWLWCYCLVVTNRKGYKVWILGSFMERSLVMIKRHSLGKHFEIVSDLERRMNGSGRKVLDCFTVPLPKEFFDSFYSNNRTKYSDWWDNLMETEFVGGRSRVLVYEGENIVPAIRNIVGPTQVLDNPKDTIRGKYGRQLIEDGHAIIRLSNGLEIYRNAIHATDETPGEFRREFDTVKPYLEL